MRQLGSRAKRTESTGDSENLTVYEVVGLGQPDSCRVWHAVREARVPTWLHIFRLARPLSYLAEYVQILCSPCTTVFAPISSLQ
jgi:hypothetical protein